MQPTPPNLTVLLTRAEGENEALAELLAQAQIQTLTRPLIKLSEVQVSDSHKQLAMSLDQYDKVIFVSKSSVRFGMPLLDSYWPQWPVHLQWFAVGPGTAEQLDAYDVQAMYPESVGSEGLLALDALTSMNGESVLIVRGVGGRELLADGLSAAGAKVEYLEIYRREVVSYDDWSNLPNVAVVLLSSIEMADGFVLQVPEYASIKVITASARIAKHVHSLGFNQVVNAGGASVQALYDAILQLNATTDL